MQRIYVASKTRHASRWRALRDMGAPIVCSWIDEAGEGESACLSGLWARIVHEVQQATLLVLYREPGEDLEGALVEAGIALGAGVRVCLVGPAKRTGFQNHPLVWCAPSIEAALAGPDTAS